MKYRDLNNRDESELKELLLTNKALLAKLYFDANSKTLKDNSQISKLRKDIARILTAIAKIHYTGTAQTTLNQ